MLPFEEILNVEYFLPFIMVFVLFYAILMKTEILGKNKNINVVVAIIVSLFFVSNDYLVGVFNRLIPNISAGFIVLLGWLLVLGLIFGKNMFKGWVFFWVMAVSIVTIWWYVNKEQLEGIEDLIPWMHYELAIVILLGILILWFFVFRKPEKKPKSL